MYVQNVRKRTPKPSLFNILGSCREDTVKMRVKHAKDRRIRRTKDLLHGALGSLIREKNYERIVVKEILARANVGRSTFYMHFRDKDDLLLSHIEDIISGGPPSVASSSSAHYEKVIWFSLPILEYIHDHSKWSEKKTTTTDQTVLHEHLRRTLTELIIQTVKRSYGQQKQTSSMPLDILAQYIATTFILVLNWWLKNQRELEPVEVDKTFRTLVLPSLNTIWG